MNILNKIRQFMIGRHGIDQLGVAIAIAYFLTSIVYNLIRFRPLIIISYIFFFLFIIRMLSKKIYKRQQENVKFLTIWNPVKRKFNLIGRKLSERNVYRFYKCPSCKQVIRVPKGKGKICITCPKCKKEFIKRT